MFAALLAACLSPPFFPAVFSPDTCDLAAQAEECRCSECMTWPAMVATSYEITRRTVSTGFEIHAGTVHERVWTDDDGIERRALPPLWCFAWDSSFPREGVLYEYRMRACNGAFGCADEWSDPVRYRAAPYDCIEGGVFRQCHPGDPVRTP